MLQTACTDCGSTNLRRKGTYEAAGVLKQRYKCNDCDTPFSLVVEEVSDIDETVLAYSRTEDWLQENVYSHRRLVITSAQNNTRCNEAFLDCLNTYTKHTGAGFIAIPTKYKTINSNEETEQQYYDAAIESRLCENTLEFPKYNLRVYAGIKIQATAENPLSGFDPLSKGWSIIIGHAQVQLKTLPNIDRRISDIITTTGAITNKNYSNTKLGEKAKFNHSMSAVVIEFDDEYYHIRHLNYDANTESFCDIDKQYFRDHVEQCSAEALITGDEHVLFADPNVKQWTYKDAASIVNTVHPSTIVRHDVLDSYSISHHHKNNIFKQYAKWQSGMNSIEDELRKTVDFINETTPDAATSLIVQSNHNEHLLRWLNEVDIKTEPWNAKIYHFLMYQMLSHTEMGSSGVEHPDPFELISRPWLKGNIKFVNRTGIRIKDIEVGAHGDIGINGARGSAKSFARIPSKTVVGHSHSPSIEKGCYVVGTSSILGLEYNKGASTWHHAHVLIHRNGKRQMLFITPRGWRLN